MRVKLRERLRRQKARHIVVRNPAQLWMQWSTIQIPLTRGQKAKREREIEVAIKLAEERLYREGAAGQPA